jgi:hypothetical protein
MPQAVPLGRRLRVEGPDVVVDDAWRFLVELLVEGLAAEEGQGALGVPARIRSVSPLISQIEIGLRARAEVLE